MSSIREQIAFDVRTKAQLERQLLKKIRSYNAKLVSSFRAALKQTGNTSVPTFKQHEKELETILLSHYQLVGGVFVNRINDLVEREISRIEKKAVSKNKPIPFVISKEYEAKASFQVRKITDTSKKNARTALLQARKVAKNSKVQVTEVEIADSAGSVFQSLLNSREIGIASLNTNAIAEDAKLKQIQIFQGEQPEGEGTKQWHNLGDSRVRDGENFFNHLNASQVVKTSQPFIVSGEKLNYPGDTSLGASTGNVINCRCSASYDIRKVAINAREQRAKKLETLFPKQRKIEKPTIKKTKISKTTKSKTLDKIIENDAKKKAAIEKERLRKILEDAKKALELDSRVIPEYETFIKFYEGETRLPTSRLKGTHYSNFVFEQRNQVVQSTKEAWKKLDNEVKVLLKENQIEIKIGTSSKGMGMPVEHPGLYWSFNKTITITDAASTNGGHTLLHEIGHALDDILGRPSSNDKRLISSWENSRANAPSGTRKRLNYYLDQPKTEFQTSAQRSVSELFAESHAQLTQIETGPLPSGTWKHFSGLHGIEFREFLDEPMQIIREYLDKIRLGEVRKSSGRLIKKSELTPQQVTEIEKAKKLIREDVIK